MKFQIRKFLMLILQIEIVYHKDNRDGRNDVDEINASESRDF